MEQDRAAGITGSGDEWIGVTLAIRAHPAVFIAAVSVWHRGGGSTADQRVRPGGDQHLRLYRLPGDGVLDLSGHDRPRCYLRADNAAALVQASFTAWDVTALAVAGVRATAPRKAAVR